MSAREVALAPVRSTHAEKLGPAAQNCGETLGRGAACPQLSSSRAGWRCPAPRPVGSGGPSLRPPCCPHCGTQTPFTANVRGASKVSEAERREGQGQQAPPKGDPVQFGSLGSSGKAVTRHGLCPASSGVTRRPGPQQEGVPHLLGRQGEAVCECPWPRVSGGSGHGLVEGRVRRDEWKRRRGSSALGVGVTWAGPASPT